MIPPVPPPPLPRLPRLTERTLDNGLRVWAARRPGIPMVELRLWIPALSRTGPERARATLQARSMLAGTADRDDLDLAAAIQSIGGTLSASTTVDGLVVRASALARHLHQLATLMASVLEHAAYPAARVRNHRERLSRELVIRRSNPATIAGDTLARRRYGRHPYGLGSPAPEQVQSVGPGALRRRHAAVVRPSGAMLIVVGDLRPARAVEQVAAALAGWQAAPPPVGAAEPRHRDAGIVQVVHRPGAVQTNIRLGSPAVTRAHPDYPALSLAVLAFGGYFASRLVANLREDKGYTYSPRASLDHRAAASHLTIVADVASEVTGAAFLEIGYELGRMLAVPAAGTELESARRYRIGGLGTSLQTQAGLASQLNQLAGGSLDIAWLRDHLRHLHTVEADDVARAAQAWMGPGRMVGVLVGDADQIAPQLTGLAEVEVVAPDAPR